jgi:GTP-binding protein LepA
MHSGGVYKVEEAGIFQLELIKTGELHAGDVGYVVTGVKTISDVRVGDTITTTAHPAKKPLPGFKDVKPVVFSSIYPVDTNDYEELVSAIERLKLNYASLIYEKDSSAALGFGSVAFLGNCCIWR